MRFFKPTWTKIGLTVLLLIFPLLIGKTFYSGKGFEGLWVLVVYFFLPSLLLITFDSLISIILTIVIDLIAAYIISCIIVVLVAKLKKRKSNT